MQETKIRAAFIAFAPFISGSERCLQLMLVHCRAYNIEPLLLIPEGSPMCAWAEQYEVEYVTVAIDNIQAKSVFQRILLNIRLCLTLAKHKVDVIHSNQIWSLKPVATAARLLKIPTVCHFRDPIDNGSRWWFESGCDTAIFISKFIATQFFETFNNTFIKAHVTQIDPIDIPTLPNGDKARQVRDSMRENLDISASTFVFGYFGQIAPVKGITQLLEALSLVEIEDWTLLIAGKAPAQHKDYYIECQQLVAEYKLTSKVRFLGFVDNVADIYVTIDMAVAPSLVEPLGLIPLEAGINEVPSIVSEVGGLPETIVENETGFLVDVNDKAAFATKLSEVIAAPDLEMGKRARGFVISRCAVPQYMERLKGIFAAAIARKS